MNVPSFLGWNTLALVRPMTKAPASHGRGFSLLDLIVMVVVMAVLASLALPPTGNTLRHLRINRAAAVVAMDLRMASSLASRQRRPVRVTYDSDLKSYTFTDVVTGALLHTRDLREFDIPTVTFAPQTTDIAPSGIASNSLTVTLATSGYDRRVTMMRAGMVRVVLP